MKTHKDLEVYKLAIDYVTKIYRVTAKFPKEEQFGISNQMRRAAVSIPSNIAEGSARQGNKELIHFLYIALGSVAELETQLTIAKNLQFITVVEFEKLVKEINQIGMMLSGLIKYRKTQ
ncbi:four helix bundle protein [Flavobacterium flavipallidum]|uniref:Four helix bundle protein n=1 Tax=Flavobacterium flavipallidum TaxID=3139140 RepID=A0ABU9HJ27_9FLAO